MKYNYIYLEKLNPYIQSLKNKYTFVKNKPSVKVKDETAIHKGIILVNGILPLHCNVIIVNLRRAPISGISHIHITRTVDNPLIESEQFLL